MQGGWTIEEHTLSLSLFGFVFQGSCILIGSSKETKLCEFQSCDCSFRHGLMGSGGYRWKYEERDKRKRLKWQG